MDLDGNLDIGIVDAEGGRVERVTTHEAVDVEPEWSRDGRDLYYVSARGGGFGIHRLNLEDGSDTSS